MEEQWTKFLTDDERKSLEEIIAWEKKPGKTHVIYEKVTSPLLNQLKNLSPAIIDSIVDTIRECLKTLRDYSFQTINRDKLLDKISFVAEKCVSSSDEIKEIPLPLLDRAARECICLNKSAATLGGGFTGAIGPNGLVLDLPLLYGLLFRIIQETAVCYGFSIDSPEEKVYVLKVLELGHTSGDETRKNTLGELQTLHTAIRGGVSLSQLEASGLIKGLQVIAERVGLGYMRRKIILLFMLIGGIAGAGANFLIASQVAEAAFHSYRKRFLMDRSAEREGKREPPSEPESEDRTPDDDIAT